jgi:hypothetical protein
MPQIGRLTASAVKIAGLFFAQYSHFRFVEEFNFLNDEKKGCKLSLTAFLFRKLLLLFYGVVPLSH